MSDPSVSAPRRGRSPVAVVLLAAAACGPAAVGGELIDFAHDVVPILKARCAACHTGGKAEGGLQFNTREQLLASGIVEREPGGAAALVGRVAADDPLLRMPPDGPPLTEREVQILAAWVDAGVPWDDGFTFRVGGAARPLALREVVVPEGPGHPIDRLLADYRSEHALPEPDPAGDAAFVRRAWLDLVGLLPPPDAVRAFAGDASPDRRARLVDGLLSRDRDVAVHWFSFWNDLLRNDYAGTGYIDGGRKPISAWLLAALLANEPYDRFARELIAPPSEASAGFIHGIRWRGAVNASQATELQFAQNVSQVFLGANLKCASCHDSFIDDWTLADAYGLAAVTAERPLELHRCEKPTGVTAEVRFPFPELGDIPADAPRAARLARCGELLTTPANGRFSRTVVNRQWHRLCGRGLVEPVDAMAGPAWSEDLLDHLAGFLVESGYDLRATLAHIATSDAYAAAVVDGAAVDADGEYRFGGPRAKRMTAEQFVDAVWTLTGTGPTAPHPQVAALLNDPPAPTRGPAVRAALVPGDPLMRSLGRPNREQVVTTRPAELSPLQALDLANGADLNRLLAGGTAGVSAETDADAHVADLWHAALSRPPTAEEFAVARDLLGSPPSPAGAADLLWGVVMLPEFQGVR